MSPEEVAAQAATAAAQVALQHFAAPHLDEWFKTDGSRVTAADLAVEAAVREVLGRLTPDVPVLAEENGGSVVVQDARWIVDPIDGTENFSRGNPVWATLIAYESAGSVVASVVSAPALGRRWTATRGAGAFIDGQRIRVSSRTSPADGTFCYGGLHECPSVVAAQRVLRAAADFRCAWGWGNFWGHVQVAQGSAEGALSFGVEVWDVAAPSLIVTEAGGSFSHLDGRSDTLLTSNGALHEKLIEHLEDNGDG